MQLLPKQPIIPIIKKIRLEIRLQTKEGKMPTKPYPKHKEIKQKAYIIGSLTQHKSKQ